jgi:hypothetical protein
MDLPLGEISALQRRAEMGAVEGQNGATVLHLRRPTGNDQREWRANVFADAARARQAMVHRLVGSDEATEEFPADLIEALEARLEEADPLVAFSIRLGCPQCGVESDIPVDLEMLALRELEREQRQLLKDVHRLATRYHWSESEILRLSPTRRARYLRLIEAEEHP